MSDRTKQITAPAGQQEEDVEAGLVAAAKRDPAAFGQLYDRYVQPVFRYLYSRVGRRPEAEDLTAQTFLAAFERLPHYRHNGHFGAWLFSIAHHKGVDYFRQQKGQAPLDAASRVPVKVDYLQNVIKTERTTALVQLIAGLPEDERELIRLRYVAELSFREIAALLDRREDAVKKTLYRLLARLRSRLEEDHG